MMDKMVPSDDDFMKGMQQQMEMMMKGMGLDGKATEEAMQKATEEAVRKDAEMAAGEFMGKKKEAAEEKKEAAEEKKAEHKEL